MTATAVRRAARTFPKERLTREEVERRSRATGGRTSSYGSRNASASASTAAARCSARSRAGDAVGCCRARTCGTCSLARRAGIEKRYHAHGLR
jgi:hypothetical protein